MDPSLNLVLWTVVVFGAAALVAIAAPAHFNGAAGAPATKTAIFLAAVAGLIAGAILWIDARSVFELSSVLFLSMYHLLPFVAILLGGTLAAVWFMRGVRPGRSSILALAAAPPLAIGGGIAVSSPETAWMLSVGAVLTIAVVAFLTTGKTDMRRTRTIGLAASIALLWAGGFLVYLMIFPQQIAVGYEQPQDAASAVDTTLPGWIIPGVLVLTFLAGFLKSRRG